MEDNPLYKLNKVLEEKILLLEQQYLKVYRRIIKADTDYTGFDIIDIKGETNKQHSSFVFSLSINKEVKKGLYLDNLVTYNKEGSANDFLTKTIIAMVESTAFELGYKNIQVDINPLYTRSNLVKSLGYQIIGDIGMKTLKLSTSTEDSTSSDFLRYLKK